MPIALGQGTVALEQDGKGGLIARSCPQHQSRVAYVL